MRTPPSAVEAVHRPRPPITARKTRTWRMATVRTPGVTHGRRGAHSVGAQEEASVRREGPLADDHPIRAG